MIHRTSISNLLLIENVSTSLTLRLSKHFSFHLNSGKGRILNQTHVLLQPMHVNNQLEIGFNFYI